MLFLLCACFVLVFNVFVFWRMRLSCCVFCVDFVCMIPVLCFGCVVCGCVAMLLISCVVVLFVWCVCFMCLSVTLFCVYDAFCCVGLWYVCVDCICFCVFQYE